MVIVSNRLPLVISGNAEEGWSVKPGTGGLVSALAPALRERGGMWIGWPGTAGIEKEELENLLVREGDSAGYELKPVPLTSREVNGYYYGFSNEILWPLFHDLQTRCNMDSDYWWAFQEANRRVAAEVVEHTRKSDTLWIHDYHLLLMGNLPRSMGVER